MSQEVGLNKQPECKWLDYDGRPAYRPEGEMPMVWRDGGWYHPADHGHYMHNACIISEAEFRALCVKVGAHYP